VINLFKHSASLQHFQLITSQIVKSEIEGVPRGHAKISDRTIT
jgi:hypothetical protein